jgi:hypothetical protein
MCRLMLDIGMVLPKQWSGSCCLVCSMKAGMLDSKSLVDMLNPGRFVVRV